MLAQLSSFEQLLIHELVHVHNRRFVRGHVVLVGDAAHAMAPNLGQGANTALVDAAVLAFALRCADNLEGALREYERRRHAPVQRVAQLASRLGMLAEWTHPVARCLRDRVLMPFAALGDEARTARVVLQEDPRALADMLRA